MDLPLLRGGPRLDWEALPAAVRQALQAPLGSPVVHATTQPGGFAPGLAARLRLDLRGRQPAPHSDQGGGDGGGLALGRHRRGLG